MMKFRLASISKALLLISLNFIVFIISAQSGPGGVGKRDGTTTLRAWYQANSGVQKDAFNKVTTWKNSVSVTSMDLYSVNSPDYILNGINNLPTISFSSGNILRTNQTLNTTDFPTNTTSVILVINKMNSLRGFPFVTYPFDAANRFSSAIPWDDGKIYIFLGDNNGGITANDYGSINVYTINDYVADPTSKEFKKNQQTISSALASTSEFNAHSTKYFQLSDATYPFVGGIAEFILFTTKINSAQRIIIDNYLSAKYNIALTTNDKYSSTTYTYDVAGIGEQADGNQTLSTSSGIYISENSSSLDANDYVMFGHNNAAQSIVTTNLPGGVSSRWNRDWYIEKTGTVDTKLAFDMSDGINGGKPGNLANYCLLYRNTATGTFSEVVLTANCDANTDQIYFNIPNGTLANGYYTLGTKNNLNSPLDGTKTWYNYYIDDNDNWDTPTLWTLDPDGSLLINPNNQTPGASDTVVILNGSTVNITTNTKTCAKIEIRNGGVLNISGTTSGHNFGKIYGSGRIILFEDNYPAGDDADFRTKGTVEYRGGGYDLAVSRSYYNLVVNLTNAGNILILNSDLTVANNFDIEKGNFKINQDGLNNAKRTINVTGNVTVQENGQISTGTGNTFAAAGYSYGFYFIVAYIGQNLPPSGQFHSIYHEFNIGGNFTNFGPVSFTNLGAPLYDEFATNGAVTVRFNGTNNNDIKLYNTAKFYNLIIDKGTNQTYISTLYSSNNSNFSLLGGNSMERNEGGAFSAANPEVRKALWIKNGTLKLTGNISIPSLSETGLLWTRGDYTIPANGCLWIDGDNVIVNGTADVAGDSPGATGIYPPLIATYQGMAVFGKLRLSRGTYNGKGSSGIQIYPNDDAMVQVEGGSMNICQFRNDIFVVGGKATYQQTGGTVTIRGDNGSSGEVFATNALFELKDANSVFLMRGGTLNITDESGYTYDFWINSNVGNYDVTGGTVNVQVNGGINFDVFSTANLWNLNLQRNDAANTAIIRLRRDLAISNDLTINENSRFDASSDGGTTNYNVSIGGNLTIGTVPTTSNAQYMQRNNITTFNGNANSTITVSNATNLFSPYELVVNKESSSNSVTLAFRPGTPATLICTVRDSLTVTNGIFDYGSFYTNVQGNLNNSGTMGTDAASGRIVLTNGPARRISTAVSGTPTYGYIELNDADGATLVNNATFYKLRLSAGLLNIGDYRLTLTNNIVDAYSATAYVNTSGSHAAKGLKMNMTGSYTAANTIVYPVGSAGVYMRCEVDFSGNTTLNGYYSVVPVNQFHPAYAGGGGCSAIPYYWKAAKDNSLSSTALTLFFHYPGGSTNGREYYFNGIDWVDHANNDGTPLDFTEGFTNADYTSAANNCFNAASIFKSNCANVAGCNWTDPASWTRSGCTGGCSNYPQAVDIAYILPDDKINANVNSLAVSNLVVYNTGILDLQATRLHTFDRVSGGGEIRVNYNATDLAPDIPAGDFEEFLTNDTAIWNYYGTTNYTVPNDFQFYPNLKLTGTSTKTLPNQDIVVFQDLTVDGNTTLINADDDLTVYKNISINNTGTLRFPNTGTSILRVNKSIIFGATGTNTFDVATGGAAAGTPHSVYVTEDININNSAVFNFYTGTVKKANLYFTGSSNSVVSNSTATLQLNYLYIQKSLLANSVTINSDLTLTNNSNKALTLTTGSLILNHANIDVNLTSAANGDFTVPENARLTASSGSIVRILGNNDLILNNRLSLTDNSQLIMNQVAGENNSIVYTASGSAEISIANTAKLLLGGQIRRSDLTEAGTLIYNQSGTSEVLVGDGTASSTSRAMFELYPGSSFTFAGGSLTIANGQNATDASLYLDPSSYSLVGGSKITFGNANTSAGPNMGIYSSIPLKNLEISSSGVAKTIKINTLALTIDSLKVNSGQTFNTNGLDLTLNGNLYNLGTFNGSLSTTTFNGSQQKLINGGTTTFKNLAINTIDSVRLYNNITVNGNLTIQSGRFSDRTYTVTLLGDLTNNGYLYSVSNTTGGIKFSGSARQDIGGSGTFGRLEVNNPNGIELQNDFYLADRNIILTSGCIYLRNNLLELGSQASVIVPSGDFSADRMLITNGAVSDKGVRRHISVGTTNVTIPMGVNGKYTKIVLSGLTTAGNGYVDVRPVNEVHRTITDPNNALSYYWNLKTVNFTSFKGQISFYYAQADVKVSGVNTEADYIPAYLNSLNLWAKYGSENIDNAANYILFNYQTGENLDGDFTAGIDAAIPSNVPVFYTKANGDWEAVTPSTIWGREDGLPVTYYPNGHIVKINHNIRITQNSKSAYKTIIGQNGKLTVVRTTIGHYLGKVSGRGWLLLYNSRLPAGEYNEFFASNGGTIEFDGDNTNYEIPSKGTVFRRLFLSKSIAGGTGEGRRVLPSSNITVTDTLLIGSTGAPILDNSTHNNTINIQGRFTLSGGSFYSGTGANASVVFNGTSAQNISGAFTGTSELNNITLNNSAGISMGGNITMKNNTNAMTLTSGSLTTGANTFLMNQASTANPDGGSTTSYVNGPVSKVLPTGSTFSFPIGKASRHGKLTLRNTTTAATSTWKTEYFNTGTPRKTNINDPVTIKAISDEYWTVTPPTGTSVVELRWNELSDINGLSAVGISNIRLVRLVGGLAAGTWQAIPSTLGAGSTNTNGTIYTNTGFAFTNGTTEYFALASSEDLRPSANFISADTSICAGATFNLRINLVNGLQWTLVYNDGVAIVDDHTVTVPIPARADASTPYVYYLPITPTSTTTYKLVSVQNSLGTSGTVSSTTVTVTVNPLPADPVAVDGKRCGTGQVLIGASGAGANETYRWYDVSSGGTILQEGTGGYTTNSLSATTNFYVAKYNTSTLCTSLGRTTVVAAVNTVPTVTLGANPTVSLGNPTAPLTYTVGLGTTLYSIDFSASAEAQNFTDVTDGTLSGGTINITVPVGPPLPSVGTYSGVLTVKNPTTECVSANNISVTIVSASATISASSTDICLGQSITLTFSLTGAPNFNLSFTDGTTTTPLGPITGYSTTQTVTPTSVGTTVYSISSISDSYGSGVPGTPNSVSITVKPAPSSGPLYRLPNY